MDVRGTNIFVGLSGGVDSSVTAALLKDAGAQVTGVFIQGWYPPGFPCTWASDRRDAMRVAARLQIPFITLNASDAYKKGVIDYLTREYRAGRTPNPDVMCNREVKFGAFYTFAKEQGADYIATGHYAKRVGHELHRGADEDKDQSYFLWAVPKETLQETLFPLGDLKKDTVRALARRFRMPVADKKDSQGICFLGSISVEDFLREEFGESVGSAVDESGAEVGTHQGTVLHTLGARVPLRNAPPGPWYVVRKDMERNVLVVAHTRTSAGDRSAITLSDTNWLSDAPDGPYEAHMRYHGPRIHGTKQGNTFTPATNLPEPAASGQSLVLYTGTRCHGGGIMG